MMKKGEASRKKLIEGLLYCLGEYGLENTTFQKVADHCDVSQALVVKTFENRENMLWTAFREIISEAVLITEKTLTEDMTATQKLESYFQVSLDIFHYRKQTARIYLLMYYLASIDEKYLAFNTKLKEGAVARIQQILELGIQKEEFHLNEDPQNLAKTIHSSLTGMLINSVTEKSAYDVRQLCSVYLGKIKIALQAPPSRGST